MNLRRFNMSAYCFVPMLVWLLGCGSNGGNVGEDQSIGERSDNRELDAACADLKGQIELGQGDDQGGNSEVILLDHTARRIISKNLNTAGFFDFECGLFTENNILSLHLIRGQRLIADFDLVLTEPGIQSAFTYAGGLGTDLGIIRVPMSNRGELTYFSEGIFARLGGGFRILADRTANISSFGLSDGQVSVHISSKLMVESAASILNSFYLGYQNPTLYQKDLAYASKVGITAIAKSAGAVRKVTGEVSGGWLRFARIAKEDGFNPSGTYWNTKEFELAGTGLSDSFGVSLFPGNVPQAGDIAYIHVFKSAGYIAKLPVVLNDVVRFPPRVVSFGLGSGSSINVIDYEASLENGLNRPFCSTGEIRLGIEPPRDALPSVTNSKSLGLGLGAKIEVKIHYFSEDQTPSSKLIPREGDFFGVYGSVYADEINQGIRRTWNPNSQTLRYSHVLGLNGMTVISVPRDVMAVNVGGKKVGFTLFRITWLNDNDGAEGSTVFWTKRHCS